MLSRKKNHKVGLKAYVKEYYPIYFDLLKLACVSDQTNYTATPLAPLISALQNLPLYQVLKKKMNIAHA